VIPNAYSSIWLKLVSRKHKLEMDMRKVSAEEFYKQTPGGRPNRANMSAYEGREFECGCGSVHAFNEHTCEVIRELRGMRFIIQCPEDKALTLIKINLWGTKLTPKLVTRREVFDTWPVEKRRETAFMMGVERAARIMKISANQLAQDLLEDEELQTEFAKHTGIDLCEDLRELKESRTVAA
jgi:hypothetical protein